MALWPAEIDPFISILPTPTPAVLPLLLDLPGVQPSIHIGLYLPTGGQESDFILALADLASVIESVSLNYRDVPIFLRGDANVNPSHRTRPQLWAHFLDRFHLSLLDIGHLTYHHTSGQGASDSPLDIIASPSTNPESLSHIICGHEDPRVLFFP